MTPKGDCGHLIPRHVQSASAPPSCKPTDPSSVSVNEGTYDTLVTRTMANSPAKPGGWQHLYGQAMPTNCHPHNSSEQPHQPLKSHTLQIASDLPSCLCVCGSVCLFGGGVVCFVVGFSFCLFFLIPNGAALKNTFVPRSPQCHLADLVTTRRGLHCLHVVQEKVSILQFSNKGNGGRL